MDPRTVEIAGAGIAGLTIATLLAREGWEVRVHERSEELRELGAGIFIKNNGCGVLAEMGLLDTLQALGERLRWAEIWDERGQLQRRTLAGPSQVWNFPRQPLLNVLHQAAEAAGVQIETGSLVTGARPDGTLLLAEGQTANADLVIAADGYRSAIRDSLGLTKRFEVRKTGAIRLLVERTVDDGEAHTSESWTGHRRVGIAACTAAETYVYMSAANSDEPACRTPVDVAAWTASFPRLASFFERLRDAEAVRHPYCYVATRRWSEGSVAIVGDAAHALPPTLGQGAGLSLINGWALAQALRHSTTLHEALASWEHGLRPVTDSTQRWALRYDNATNIWPNRLGIARSGVIWGVGRARRLNRRMRIADRVDPGALQKSGYANIAAR